MEVPILLVIIVSAVAVAGVVATIIMYNVLQGLTRRK
jgi:hypothetical protein